MGLDRQQIQVHIDFDLREATLLARSPLELAPRAIKVPFPVLKGIVSQILKAEAEDELSILTGLAEETASQEKKG